MHKTYFLRSRVFYTETSVGHNPASRKNPSLAQTNKSKSLLRWHRVLPARLSTRPTHGQASTLRLRHDRQKNASSAERDSTSKQGCVIPYQVLTDSQNRMRLSTFQFLFKDIFAGPCERLQIYYIYILYTCIYFEVYILYIHIYTSKYIHMPETSFYVFGLSGGAVTP